LDEKQRGELGIFHPRSGATLHLHGRSVAPGGNLSRLRCVAADVRRRSFASDRTRVEYFFQLYEQLTAPLAPSAVAADPKRQWKGIGAAPPAQ
jgi:hypothetical protein